MFVVQRVGGRDHDAVELAVGEQIVVVFGCVSEAEVFLNSVEFIGAQPTDGGQLDVLPFGQYRHMVAGRPPSGSYEAEFHFFRHFGCPS